MTKNADELTGKIFPKQKELRSLGEKEIMLCPQCNAPMSKHSHNGLQSPYFTLNCSHCKFTVFYRGQLNFNK